MNHRQQNPILYRAVSSTIYVKSSKNPKARRVIEVKLAEGKQIKTTGNIWEGEHGNVWAEVDRSRHKDWGWVCVTGGGFSNEGPMLVVEEVYGVVAGPKRGGRARQQLEHEEDFVGEQHQLDGTDVKPTADPMHFRVMTASIAIRSAPSTHAPTVGGLSRGKVVFGAPCSVNDSPWLEVAADECKRLYVTADKAWILIHGSCLGLGQLLQRLDPEEERVERLNRRMTIDPPEVQAEVKSMLGASLVSPSEFGDPTPGPVPMVPHDLTTVACYMVMAKDPVVVLSGPNDRASRVSSLNPNKVVSGTARNTDGCFWLCLDKAECRRLSIDSQEAFMQISGLADEATGPPIYLRMLNAEEERMHLSAQKSFEEERAQMEAVMRQAEAERRNLELEKAAFEARRAAAAGDGAATTPNAPAQPKVSAAPKGPVQDWTVDEVVLFLEELKLGKFVAKFRDYGVDGQTLADLTEEDLMQELELPKLVAHKVTKNLLSLSTGPGCPKGRCQDWNVNEVLQFLNWLGFAQYAEKFKDYGVDGQTLVDLSEEDLMTELDLPRLVAGTLRSNIPK